MLQFATSWTASMPGSTNTVGYKNKVFCYLAAPKALLLASTVHSCWFGQRFFRALDEADFTLKLHSSLLYVLVTGTEPYASFQFIQFSPAPRHIETKYSNKSKNMEKEGNVRLNRAMSISAYKISIVNVKKRN